MYRLFITLLIVFSDLCLFCGDPPTNPFSPENAKISLILKSSTFQESDSAVTDTVGKIMRLGLCLYLTQCIDSTIITVIQSPTRNDTVLKCTLKNKTIDTVFYDLVFSTPGTRTVSAIAHVGKELRQATVKIHIIARPQPNRRPELAVTGTRTITTGQACTLKVSASDPDSGQAVTVDTLRSPRGSVFSDSVFIWQTAIADTGVDTVIFIARDNGSPVLTDTEVVSITVNPAKINHPPKWRDDTVSLSGIVGWPITLPLADKCSDPDNDTLVFALLVGAPDGDTVQETIYSFSPLSTHEGTFYPCVVARDPQQLSDTLVIKLTINPADTTPPTIRRISPSDDSSTISTSSCQVRVSATDKSGIHSVRCFKAADSILVTRTDTVYTATVSGIIQNQYTKITFIAIDSSPNANQCTLSVHIKFDPTLLDNEPPVITLLSPAKDTVSGEDSCKISVRCTDASGVKSVTMAIGSTSVSAIREAENVFTATIRALPAGRYSTITITVIDSATTPHSNTATVKIKYDNDTAGPIITRVMPARDSISTNASGYMVSLQCADSSGVLSVNGVMGAATFFGVRGSNNLWSVTITGLQLNAFNAIQFTAIDSSLRANKSSLALHIKYDPTMDDADGPVIQRISGPESGDTVNNPAVVLVDSITDPNGIDSVVATLNGGAKTLLAGVNGRYTFSGTLAEGVNTIVISAKDKSTAGNRSTQTLIIVYRINIELKALSFSNATLSPAFSPETLSYSAGMHFTNSSTSVTAVLADSQAVLLINGELVSSKQPFAISGITGDTASITVKVLGVDRATFRNYTVRLIKTNTAPSFTSTQDNVVSNIPLGTSLVDTIRAKDVDGDTLIFSMLGPNIRNNMAIDSKSGIFTWLVDTIAYVPVTVSVFDGRLYDTLSYFLYASPNVWILPQGTNPQTENGLVLIKAKGHAYLMGSNNGNTDERPVHWVGFTYDFWAGQYEVPQNEYQSVMDTNPSTIIGSNLPANYISWKNAVRYCIRRSLKDGYENCYDTSGTDWVCDFTKNGYRLPSEAEWEYACRGGTTSEFFTGDTLKPAYATYNTVTITPVGTVLPNPYKLYDMIGNVGEWCYDRNDPAFYIMSPHIDPTGSTNTQIYYRAERGGSYQSVKTDLRSSKRDGHGINSFYTHNGFRIFRTQK